MPSGGTGKVRIPTRVGAWESGALKKLWVPHFEQPIVWIGGAVFVVLEHHNLSQAGCVAAHEALNKYAAKITAEIIRDFDPTCIQLLDFMATIKTYFADAFRKKLTGIEDIIIDAVKNNQSILQNLWTLAHKDELIGYDFQIFTNFGFEDEANTEQRFDFSERWTTEKSDWEIFGEAYLEDME